MLQLCVRTYTTLSFHVNMYYCTIIVHGRVLGSNGIVHSMWVIFIHALSQNKNCDIYKYKLYSSVIP